MITIDTFGGRKMVAGAAILAIGVGIVAFKGDVPPNMLTLLLGAFAAFVTGNSVEHITDASVDKAQAASAAPQAPDTSPAPLAASISELTAEVGQVKGAVANTQELLVNIAKRVFPQG